MISNLKDDLNLVLILLIIIILMSCSGCDDIALAQNPRFLIVDIAMKEVGHGEEGGDNRGKYVKRYEVIQGQPWCAAFATWVWKQARVSSKVKLRALDIYAEAKHRKALIQDPLPGDIAIWKRDGGPGTGHCGIVVATDNDNQMFYSVEGNVGPYPAKVKIIRHYIDEPKLLGFAEPAPPFQDTTREK